MDRRTFVCSSAGAWLAAPLAARAQKPRRVVHIGILSPARAGPELDDVARALQQFGYVDGRSAVIEWRGSGVGSEHFSELARELVGLKVDVIIALGSEAAQAAKQATTTIPIVFGVGDPVGTGLVQSLGRPGGNLTGVTNQLSDLATKYLQLLRDALPEASNLAVLCNPTNASVAHFLHDVEGVAAQLRFTIRPVALASAEDLKSAFAALARARPHAMLVIASPVAFANESLISEFAIKNRIPTLASAKRMVEQGLLMFYGPTLEEGDRQIADYVDKVLKGARPADLPVQQPTRLELVVNLKTAKAVGLTLPQSLLLRADVLIE